MIKSSIEKLAEEIGFEIGTSDDITQSKLLNSFFKGLRNSIRIDSDLDMQICYIVNKLDENSKNMIKIFNEFIDNQIVKE
jgi:hypothetical protein